MNKEMKDKIITFIKKQKVFILITIVLVVGLILYLNLNESFNVNKDTFESGLNSESKLSSESTNNDSATKDKIMDKDSNDKLLTSDYKIVDGKLEIKENIINELDLVDNKQIVKYDNKKCNFMQKSGDDYEYVNYEGKAHKIKEVTNENIKTLSVGDYIYYGTYNKDLDSTLDNDLRLLFRVVKIEGEIATLHSVFAIESSFGVVGSDGYQNSTLRTYLNNDFYNTAFTYEERSRIVKTDAWYYKNYTGDTKVLCSDYVYTLSMPSLFTYYERHYNAAIMLKTKNIKWGYNLLENDSDRSDRLWLMDKSSEEYSGSWFHSVREKDIEKERYVLPIINIHIGNTIDDNTEWLPDINMLNLRNKTIYLDKDFYYIDRDTKFYKISNYNGEQRVSKKDKTLLSEKVAYVYKRDDQIYFFENLYTPELHEAEYGTLMKVEGNAATKIADNVYPFLDFESSTKFKFLVEPKSQAKDETYTYYVISGKEYIYDVGKVEITDASKESIYSKKIDNDEGKGYSKNAAGKVYEPLNIVFYDKGADHYILADGKEYKMTTFVKKDNVYDGRFNGEENICVKKNNIYFSTMNDFNTEEKYLYAIYKENGKVNILKVDSSKEYIKLLYVVEDKLYYVKCDDYGEFNVHRHFTICSYAFGNEKKDLYNVEGRECSYSSEIDTAYSYKMQSDGSYYCSIEAVTKDGIKVIDSKVYNQERYVTPYGVYFESATNDGICYYDGALKTIIDKSYLKRIEFTNDYRFAYIESNYFRTADLNDYITNIPDKENEQYQQKIGDKDVKDFKFLDSAVYVACKDNIKKISDSASIRSFGDEIVVTTYKERDSKIIDFDEALKVASTHSYGIYSGSKIEGYLSYIFRDIKFNYIFKGDKGTRFNKGDSYNFVARNYLIRDNICVCANEGIYEGNVNYDQVTNLYKLLDGDKLDAKYLYIKNDNKKIFYANMISRDMYSPRLDLYCLNNGKNENIAQNIVNYLLNEDIDGNLYFMEVPQYFNEYTSNTLYKLVDANGNIKKQELAKGISYLRDIKFIDNTYDEIENEDFYNSDNNNLLDRNKFGEDNAENTILKDFDKTKSVKKEEVKSNFNELSVDYLEGSKKFYQVKNPKVYKFYSINNELYIYLNDDLKLVDKDFSDDHRIMYDAVNDIYYYDKREIKNDSSRIIYANSFKIVDGKIKKIDTIKLKDESEEWDYFRKYVGTIDKTQIYVGRNGEIYKRSGNSLTKVANCGLSNGWREDEFSIYGNLFHNLAINSYEGKIYYLSLNSLYMMDKTFKPTKIAENVEGFIALQNEVLYSAKGLFRYSNGQSEKLLDDEVFLYGRQNDKKCYIVTRKNKLMSEMFSCDSTDEKIKTAWNVCKKHWTNINSQSMFLYENGKLNKLIDNIDVVKCVTKEEYDQDPIAGMENSYLVANSLLEPNLSLDFNDFYNRYKYEDLLNNEVFASCLKEYFDSGEKYIYLINQYDITETQLPLELRDVSFYNIKVKSFDGSKLTILNDKEKWVIDFGGENKLSQKEVFPYAVTYDVETTAFDENNDYVNIKVKTTENYLYEIFK